jgi:pyruvate/2-oxoacid:ferredoxin oxidoreductase beta subunit
MNIALQTRLPVLSEYYSETKCVWCEGCGNYGIWTAVKYALVTKFASVAFGPWPEEQLSHHIRPAQQCKLRANDRAGEFAHATRPANEHKPQRDPRAYVGEHGLDLLAQPNPTFVARGFSGDIKLMTRILKAAIQHRGFAFVDMLQACPTYNHFVTDEYLLDRYFDANADGHDPSNLQQAKALATQVQDRIACGILYQREDIPHFYNRLIPRQGLETTCVEEVRRYDVSEYWKELV